MIDLDDDVAEILVAYSEVFGAIRMLAWSALQYPRDEMRELVREIADLADDFHGAGHIVKLNRLSKRDGDYVEFSRWLGEQAQYARRGMNFENARCSSEMVRRASGNIVSLYEQMIAKIEAA